MADQNGAGAAKPRARLTREPGTVRPRGRLERAEDAEAEARGAASERGERGERAGRGDSGERGERGRSRRSGRPEIMGEVNDLNRSVAFAGIEAAAIAMDVFSRVLRGAVDRALDEDYQEPGDIVRGVANEADLAAFDLVDEMRQVPRRLSHRFETSLKSPRADRGERARRAADAATPADSPAAHAERAHAERAREDRSSETRAARPEPRRRPD